MTDAATSWAEQEAIEKWWNKHRLELKQMVTVERVRLQEENGRLKKELVFVRAVVEKCTPNDYARTQAELKELQKEIMRLEQKLCTQDKMNQYAHNQREGREKKLRKQWEQQEANLVTCASEIEKLEDQVRQLEHMKGVQWKK